jgi:hypothetical protein
VFLSVSDGTINNQVYLTGSTTTSNAYWDIIVGGSSQNSNSRALYGVGVTNAAAVSVTAAGMVGSINRLSPYTVMKAGFPKPTAIVIGQTWGGSSRASMHAISITLWAGPSSTARLQGGNY